MSRTSPTTSNQPVVPVKISRLWNTSTIVYTKPGYVIVQDGCFAFMFTNIGDTPALVNGITVFPADTPTTKLGDSRSIGAHEGDEYRGKIDIRFFNMAANPRIEIVQLFYVD